MVERALKKIFDREMRAGDLDKDIWKYNYKRLLRAIEVGGIATDLDSDHPDYDLGEMIKDSALTFTAFKNHSNVTAMVNALTDENGKLRTWSKFKKAAKEISKDYNKNWLAAEYRTSVKSVRMAKIWQRIEDKKDKQPYLVYRTQQDDNVRDSHRLLHNICKPVDDPFWDEFYPPNGWRCRCFVRQRSKCNGNTEVTELPTEKQMPKAFRVNTGKSGNLYSDHHPYFDNVSEADKMNIDKAIGDL